MAFRFQVLNSCICSVLLIQKQRNVYLSFFVYFRLEWEFCLSLIFALLTKCSSFISILESTFSLWLVLLRWGSISSSLVHWVQIVSRWCFIFVSSINHTSLVFGWQAPGMISMMRELQIPLLGSHHVGIDDTRNIARVMQRMLTDGALLQLTARRTPGSSNNVKFLFENRI